jgi:hypothetical protein
MNRFAGPVRVRPERGKEAKVNVRARASAPVLLAAAVVAGSFLGTAGSGSAAPRDACGDALAYERTASDDGLSRQAAYDAAVAGLTVNQTCTNAQQRLVNEAYLLSMRAAAAHDLKVGDWRRDLARANMLLQQCTGWPGLARTRTAENCRAQLQFNRTYEAGLAAAPAPSAPPASALPSPRPPR